MYYRQPHVPKVKIVVSLDTFKTLLSFRLECQGSSQDGFTCLARMHDEHAFEQMDVELDGLGCVHARVREEHACCVVGV
eukprot:JZ550822.1.p4 GENE.JZ550822.1~~JZ550822.1.p4  ORF type:complete len:79 (+),score=17.52 JZ550822.1:153-389(+)